MAVFSNPDFFDLGFDNLDTNVDWQETNTVKPNIKPNNSMKESIGNVHLANTEANPEPRKRGRPKMGNFEFSDSVTEYGPGAGKKSKNIEVENAQSWLHATHPEGPGDSQLVQDINYDGANKQLAVTYRDGFTALYDDIPRSKVRAFTNAASKGRWAHRNLWKLPYTQG